MLTYFCKQDKMPTSFFMHFSIITSLVRKIIFGILSLIQKRAYHIFDRKTFFRIALYVLQIYHCLRFKFFPSKFIIKYLTCLSIAAMLMNKLYFLLDY